MRCLAALWLMFALWLGGCAYALPDAPSSPRIAAAAAVPAQPPSANAAFEELSARYLAGMSALNPVYATQIGDHRYDSHLPDVSAQGRGARTRFAETFLDELQSIHFAALSRANQVDYKLLQNALEYTLWRLDVEQQWAWNPQYYHSIASSSLYALVSRDYAPFAERYPHIIARMQALPRFLAQARAQVQLARVPRVHAETVAKQNRGILSVVDGIIAPEIAKAELDDTAFGDARARLAEAIEAHQQWLDTAVVPAARGEFRLGAQKYAAKMGYALQSDMSVAELHARARQAFEDTRTAMFEVSRRIGRCGSVAAQGGAQSEAQDAALDGALGKGDRDVQAVIECGLNASYENRAARDGLEEAARQTLAEAEAFTKARGFIRMADNETQIITMPEFWQGNAVAYLDSPPPLERHLPAYYAVSPIPEGWSDEQATSFLKEYNISMLHLLSIHEGTPGHALQLEHSNRYDGVLRAVLQSGPFIEGWAVYSEKVMADEGYLGGMESEEGRFFLLNGLKFRLRAITNTLLDIGIHNHGMTREEAMDLMMRGAFQQEREAAGKWVRANLTSIQLLSYFTGYAEHVALREEAEVRLGAEFDQRRYHDGVLSFGSPPVKYARALLFGLEVE